MCLHAGIIPQGLIALPLRMQFGNYREREFHQIGKNIHASQVILPLDAQEDKVL